MEKEKLTGPELRKELVDRAGDLFQQKGYSRTSVQDIVDAAGVTKGSFYYYFQGKEDLLFLIHDEYMTRILEVARQIEADAALNNRDKLKAIIYDIIHSIGEGFAPHAKVFFQEIKHLKPEHMGLTKTKRKQYRKLVAGIIRAGIQSGELRSDLDPDLVAFGLFGMCNWSYQWMKPGGENTLSEIANTFTAILLDGISPKH